ncbi:MAG: dynamin family protein [Albidovulum sp.]|nr:dynamin family protein [Albidovulum sp.]
MTKNSKTLARQVYRPSKESLNTPPVRLLSVQQQLAEASVDLENARIAVGVVERQVETLVEHIPAMRRAMSSLSDHSPEIASEILDAFSNVLAGMRTGQHESENYIKKLSDHALRFRRLRAFVDKFLLSIKVNGSSGIPESVDAVCDNLDRNNTWTRDSLDEMEVFLKDLRQVTQLRERHSSQMMAVVDSTRSFLVEAQSGEWQRQESDALRLCSAVENKLYKAISEVEQCRDFVSSLIDHFKLLGSIMSAEPGVNGKVENSFQEFKLLLSEYYEESHQDNFPAEAEAYLDLLNVQSRLARVRLAPRLANKHIVAVAGGFSSGKSSFINSLIGRESSLLPADISPTTSIPTYVYHMPGEPMDIALFNIMGGKQRLDERTLHTISHKYEEYFGIPLNQIVDRIVVSTPKLQDWGRVAFVDTPGYTKPEGDQVAKRDVDLTLTEVISSQYLVWLVDCEQGTLTDTDINYINRFHERQYGGVRKNDGSVYIVVNKADKKPAVQCEEILGHLSELAVKVGIPCSGIGMYSARLGKWYNFVDKSFDDFLNDICAREPDLGLKAEVHRVLKQYVEFHRIGFQECKSRRGLLKRLGLLVDDELRQADKLVLEISEFCTALELEEDQHKTHEIAYASLLRRFNECMDRFLTQLEGVELPT